MAGNLDTYNAEIMGIFCPKCGAAPRVRCGGGAQRPRASCEARRTAAGWFWNKQKKALERITYGEEPAA